MEKPEKRRFIHSVKVPRLYKTASLIAKKVVEEGGSLKDLVYSSNHKNIKGVYALVVEAIKHGRELDSLLSRSKLLENEAPLQPWLAKILLTELFFGKKELKGWSKPVLTVLSYKEKLENLLAIENVSVENKLIVKKPKYVRVNTLQCTPDEIIKSFRKDGWSYLVPPTEYSQFLSLISNLDNSSFTRDFHIKEILIFPSYMQFYDNELYQNGSILLQDKASCLPAFLLKPKPESVALDMCAAPGMKTTHLSAIMKNKGKIYATEIKSDRYKVLTEIVQGAGCTNVTPINIDALKLSKSGDEGGENYDWAKDVEYILVDPSCSGSGIVDRINVFDKEKIDENRLNKLCGFQFKLLMHALTNFPKVKRIVYSTCSVYSQENEKVVEDALMKLNSLHCDDKQNSIPKFRLGEPLKDSWTRRGSKKFEHSKNFIFADPTKDLTNGFFVAVFERIENDVDEPVNSDEKHDDTIPEKKKKEKKEKKRKKKEEEKKADHDCLTIIEEEDTSRKNKEKKNEHLTNNEQENEDVNTEKKKKKKKKKNEHQDIDEEENEDSSRSNKKRKRKRSEKIDDAVSGDEDVQQEETVENDVVTVKKKKKRKVS